MKDSASPGNLAIEKPTLLLNRQRARQNIQRMADRARQNGVRFRPHFKTHQSAAIGEWFRDYGVECITVSSVDMANYFAKNGWNDITIAFPVNLRQLQTINMLASEIQLNLLVESMETTQVLTQQLRAPVNVWIKVDAGYGRTGIPWDHFDEVISLAREVHRAGNLTLSGLLVHAGHAYRARSKAEVERIYQETVIRMETIQEQLEKAGFSSVQLSIGDTPCCSLVEDFRRVDEVRPGNFVFYDVQQLRIGACREEDIAVAVACPVVAKHADRNELVIYGGAVHFSKDFIVDEAGQRIYGGVSLLSKDGWTPLLKNAYLSSLSQEHGIIKMNNTPFGEIHPGDVVAILPVHSCLTVNLLKKYTTLDGTSIEAATLF